MKNDLTIGFTTIDRNAQCQDAIKYLRSVFPDTPILVADQNVPRQEMKTFYQEYRVEVKYVGNDIGLSAARNHIVDATATRYLLLCDDDVIEMAVDEVWKSLDFMLTRQDVLAVGGRAEKLAPSSDGVDHQVNPDFDYFILRDREDSYVAFQSIHMFGLESYTEIEEGFFVSDVVENFVIFDLHVFRKLKLSWDERIKIKNEHLDFYMSLKSATGKDNYKVIYNPRLIVSEIDGLVGNGVNAFRAKRTRNNYTAIYCDKWGLSQEFHVGKWINNFNGYRYESVPWEKRHDFSDRELSRYQQEGERSRYEYSNYMVDQAKLTFVATTMSRYEVAESFVLSVRRFFPMAKIVLGVQSSEFGEELDYLESNYRVNVVKLPEDVGLSAARNRMLDYVKSKYFILCDDDFIIDERFFLNNAYRVLEENNDIGIVGGYYRDVLYDQELRFKNQMNRQFTMKFKFEEVTSTLIRIPFNYILFDELFDSDLRCVPVDCVNNLAIFRRSIFDDSEILWDDHMKISGEHIDFYFNLFKTKNIRIVYDPSFSVLHNRRQNTKYIKYRNRRSGITLFYDKWGIDNEIDFDLGIKSVKNGVERWNGFC